MRGVVPVSRLQVLSGANRLFSAVSFGSAAASTFCDTGTVNHVVKQLSSVGLNVISAAGKGMELISSAISIY